MSNRTLSQRAHALQAEVARAMEPGNKTRLKHTQAMEILARVDGHRNREAAASATTEGAAASAPRGEAKQQTLDPTQERFSFDVLFEDGMGFLGGSTNGTPPDPILGFRVQCNEEDVEFETGEPDAGSLWLHAITKPGPHRDYGWFLCANDWKQMKAVLGIVMAASRGPEKQVLPDVSAWQNQGQLVFDEKASEELWDITELRCVGNAEGFNLSATVRYDDPRLPTPTKGRNEVVARMEGKLGKADLYQLAETIREAEAWYAKRRGA